jgi:hypothetical protein
VTALRFPHPLGLDPFLDVLELGHGDLRSGGHAGHGEQGRTFQEDTSPSPLAVPLLPLLWHIGQTVTSPGGEISGALTPWHQTMTGPARGDSSRSKENWRLAQNWLAGASMYSIFSTRRTLGSLVLVGNMRHHLEVVPNEEIGDQVAVDVHRSLRPAQRDRENIARRSDAHCANRAGHWFATKRPSCTTNSS